jgi:aspartate racemase
MRTLGLLGGMSWESTAIYYRRLNEMARERLGGQHSARLLLWSADFAPMAALQSAGDWDAATRILVDAALSLERAGAEALLICANTMHRMASEIQAALAIPLLHVADATAAKLLARGARRPLLIATKFTMEEPFWRARLAAGGVGAVIPPADARERLHAIIYDELVQGRFEEASRRAVGEIVERETRAARVDSLILGCTEFGLLLGPADVAIPVFDTTEIHARAGIDFAFGA